MVISPLLPNTDLPQLEPKLNPFVTAHHTSQVRAPCTRVQPFVLLFAGIIFWWEISFVLCGEMCGPEEILYSAPETVKISPHLTPLPHNIPPTSSAKQRPQTTPPDADSKTSYALLCALLCVHVHVAGSLGIAPCCEPEGYGFRDQLQ